MIVELTGLPGSGKTTCESLLAPAFAESGFRVVMEPELIRHYVQHRIYSRCRLDYGLRRFLSIRAIVHLIYRQHLNLRDLQNRLSCGRVFGAMTKAERLPCQWLAQDMLLGSYFRETFSAHPGERTVYFAPEGLLQHTAAVRVWAGERFRGISDSWRARESCNDIVVVRIGASIDSALERLWKRGAPRSWPRHAKTTPQAARNVLERFSEAIEESVSQFQSAGSPVVTLDNNGDEQALRPQVDRFVEVLERGELAPPHSFPTAATGA